MPECIVRVLSEGEVIDCVRRRMISLPDGRDAVSYAGILFPVKRPGSSIDLSGDRHLLEGVSPLESGAPVNHTIRLYMDDSGSSSRLMVDGDVVVRDYVASVLDEASVFAKASPAANTPAADGRCYDWCFELEKDDIAAELKHHVDALCAALPLAGRTDTGLMQRGNAGTAGLTSANVEVSSDGLRLVRRSSRAAVPEDIQPSATCRLVIERLHALLSVNVSKGAGGESPLSAINIAKWRERVADGPRFAVELFEDLVKAEEVNSRLNQQLDGMTRERDRLQTRVVKKVSVSKVLGEIFPEIEFLGDSATVIDEDFTSVRMLGSTLKVILGDDPSTRENPVRGRRHDWFEVHVATGTRSNGRVYFHRVTPLKVQVLVSLKVDQKHDTEWIRSLP
ncbi:MAG: hypothetical protein K8S94_15660 [Planctomycetia bacterium]|nr:hypothetical protein [Planctomycetia bacterium]